MGGTGQGQSEGKERGYVWGGSGEGEEESIRCIVEGGQIA